MNNIDAFILALLALHSYLVLDLGLNSHVVYLWSTLISVYIPLLFLIPRKYQFKLIAIVTRLYKCSCNKEEEEIEELSESGNIDRGPRRMMSPDQYQRSDGSSEGDALLGDPQY